MNGSLEKEIGENSFKDITSRQVVAVVRTHHFCEAIGMTWEGLGTVNNFNGNATEDKVYEFEMRHARIAVESTAVGNPYFQDVYGADVNLLSVREKVHAQYSLYRTLHQEGFAHGKLIRIGPVKDAICDQCVIGDHCSNAHIRAYSTAGEVRQRWPEYAYNLPEDKQVNEQNLTESSDTTSLLEAFSEVGLQEGRDYFIREESVTFFDNGKPVQFQARVLYLTGEGLTTIKMRVQEELNSSED